MSNLPEAVLIQSVSLGYIFLLSCYRAVCVTAFASNFYVIRSSIPAGVATVFFAGLHHTVAWDVRTGALLKVIHQLRSKINVTEKTSLMPMPACLTQVAQLAKLPYETIWDHGMCVSDFIANYRIP